MRNCIVSYSVGTWSSWDVHIKKGFEYNNSDASYDMSVVQYDLGTFSEYRLVCHLLIRTHQENNASRKYIFINV